MFDRVRLRALLTLIALVMTVVAAARTKPAPAAPGVLGVLYAQGTPSGVQPLRAQPSEKLAITAGFRDWGPATLAGGMIIGTNMTGRGGVFAFDAATGQEKWRYRAESASCANHPVVVTADACS